MIKKTGCILLGILMMLTTMGSWVAAFGQEDGIIKTPVPQIQMVDKSLEEVLSIVTGKTGVRLIAVPEVAGMKVTMATDGTQTIGQVLESLCKEYQLSYQVNGAKKTIVVLKAPYEVPRAMTMMKSHETLMAVMPAPGYGGGVNGRIFNTEEYKRIDDNTFQDPLQKAFSTFSIDVDTASYSNIRRFVNMGKLPPVDSVRTEELINYFSYDYPQPEPSQPFSLTVEVGECPWNSGHKLALVGLQGKNIPREELPPSNLVFLIDVSGSMNEPNKLPLLKTAFSMLVRQLRAEDRVSIVVYAGQAGVVLENASGDEREKILQAIDKLQAGGSTAGGEGIRLAYKMAREHMVSGGNNRVILATDGDFNVGVSSEGELSRLIEEERKSGVFLNVLGFGKGNIKDNKMETLADKGNGMYAYIDNAQEAKKVLVGQMAGTLYTIAKDVKIQVEFNPAQVQEYRLIGYENRVMDDRDFQNDKADAGDMGAGHSVTALYEIIPGDGKIQRANGTIYQQTQIVPSEDLMQIKVRYKNPGEEKSRLMEQKISGSFSKVSDNLRFAAAVSEYAMLLRNSEYKGNSSYQQLLDLARKAKGTDPEGYRAEFIKIVEVSQWLNDK